MDSRSLNLRNRLFGLLVACGMEGHAPSPSPCPFAALRMAYESVSDKHQFVMSLSDAEVENLLRQHDGHLKPQGGAGSSQKED